MPSANLMVCHSRPASLTAERCSSDPIGRCDVGELAHVAGLASTSPKGCQEPSANLMVCHSRPAC